MSIATTTRIEVPGAGVSALVRRGAGTSAPTLLLIHPANLQAASWEPVAGRLPADWSWAAIDLPGHGGSAHRPEYDVECWRTACGALLDHLGWSGPHVVGASVGAAVGASLSGIRSLVTLGGALEPLTAEEAEPFITEVASRGARAVLTELVAGERGMNADDVRDALAHLNLAGDRNAVRIWSAAAAVAAIPYAATITCPTLVIAGEYDEGCPPADAHAFAAATAGRAVVLPGHGHLPMYSAAAEVAALITQHVQHIEEQEGTR